MDSQSLHSTCTLALDLIEGAETLSMAEWLTDCPNGRGIGVSTLRQAWSEAAALAAQLDRRLVGMTDSGGDVDRSKRPVLAVNRELHECVTRIAARLESEDLDLEDLDVSLFPIVQRLVLSARTFVAYSQLS